MKDYMLSKVYLEPMIKRLTTKIRLLSLFRADIIQLKKLLDTRAEYLNATFNGIEQKFGSIESFFSFLGLDLEKRKKLTELLCSKHRKSGIEVIRHLDSAVPDHFDV